jgi:hypothetical protein
VTPVNPATVVTRVDHAFSERLDDETVVLDAREGRYVALNRTATVLWEALHEPATVGGLAEHLARECGIDRDRALADVRAFVEGLAARNLVTLA